MDQFLDNFLLGMVDCVVPICRNLYRKNQRSTVRNCVLRLTDILPLSVWFATFGGTAMSLEAKGIASISKLALEESLFGVFDQYPLGTLMSILAIILVVIFFVTSADSGTYVLAMMSTNGSPNPANRIKIIWGILLTATALVLLYSGGLTALQNSMIVAALPFSIIMLLMMTSLLKSLNKEVKEMNEGTEKVHVMKKRS